MKLTRYFGLDPEFVEDRLVAADHAEKRLMFAVLEDAIRCFQGVTIETRIKRRAINEAENWLMSDVRDTFSYRCVCEVLGIDPDFLRAGLKQWRDRGGRISSQTQFAPFADTGKTRIIGNHTKGLPSGRDPQMRRLS